jgi:V8-like Glu-specific endopeptidase
MIQLFLLTLINTHLWASTQAVYGEDNRKDVFAETNNLWVELSLSTAALIERKNIKIQGDVAIISAKSLGDMYRLCPGEKFSKQPTAANCSGTLVAPDRILTAAHCYDLPQKICKDYVWVFDYKATKTSDSSITVGLDKVYDCQDVIYKEMNLKQGIDQAVIKLNRPVLDRNFAKLKSRDNIKLNDPLVLIGHPSGLPTKIAGDAYILKLLKNSFVSNVDAFSVNSGSGVFNALDGQYVGILSSGRQDYDGHGTCTTTTKYNMVEGNETVVLPQNLEAFLN